MATKNSDFVIFFTILLNIIPYNVYCATYSIKYETLSDCATGESDVIHEYFDTSQLTCMPCAQNQTVSADGLSCACRSGFKTTQDFGGASVKCEWCGPGKVTSSDGWDCVECANGLDPLTSECNTCQVTSIDGTILSRNIGVERLLDGSWGTPASTRTCQTCADFTGPDQDASQCFRCNQVLSVLPGQTDCTCPTDNQVPGGQCFQNEADIEPVNQQLFKVVFNDNDFTSAYFAENVQAAAGMCKHKYGSHTACEHLANLCVLKLYNRDYLSSLAHDACSLYSLIALEYSAMGIPSRASDWPPNMPWLFYEEETADEVLTDKGIPTEYTFPDTALDLEVAMFSINGSFLGYEDATGGKLQLCPDSSNVLDAAYKFGTFYDQSCKVNVQDLWDEEKYPLYFYDVYLAFADGNENNLYGVPVLILNYEDDGGNLVNQEVDRAEWKLVRRLFLVDNISGKRTTADTDPVTQQMQPVRYAKDITINVELQTGTSTGMIYPPYIEVTYAVATAEDYEENLDVTLTFKVNYRMNMDQYSKDVGIAVGVLGALAVTFSGLQVWGWSRRSGRIGIDFVVLCKFLIYAMGNLANVFFVVLLGTSLWWIIFYKQQNQVSLVLPNPDQEKQFVAFLASAFVLKFLQLLHILVCQVTVDIFFIDWERPKGKVISSNDAQQKGKESPVSIWRTYFAANEWNEIQTTRKVNHMLQIFATVLFLNVFGFGNLATADPNSNFRRSEDEYYSNDSRVFRFAIAAMTYLLIAIIQWVFYTFIYERFIEDKVRQYVDLCSMSNISVFILETGQFGYYIHGRSVHGRSDTGMRDMAENLKREEENLCGQRGLVPNTEQQTFQIAVPAKLRHQYDKVLRPIYAEQATPGARTQPSSGGGGSHIDVHTDNCLRAYDVLNRFLQALIDHSLREIDYIVKDKTFLENVLNMEFVDPLEQSFFYNDSGHSFDSVLLFGHENTLIIFEILFFCLIDLVSGNYILAAVMVYILMELFRSLRDGLGRSNLAKKTLVDKRFLI